MHLYHFTAIRFLSSIRQSGISRGVMLKSMNPAQFIFEKQWLTTNPSFEQPWARGTGILPYKRNEIRLKISIPYEFREKVKPWSQMKYLAPEVAAVLSCDGDPENWMIFDGYIRPHWIVECKRNPAI